MNWYSFAIHLSLASKLSGESLLLLLELPEEELLSLLSDPLSLSSPLSELGERFLFRLPPSVVLGADCFAAGFFFFWLLLVGFAGRFFL